jgi:selenocysteine lyase/cysteine desulfurase
VRFRSSRDDEKAAGMVSFTVEGIPGLELQARLAEQNVRTRVIGEYQLGWMRLSASIYNTHAQIDRVADLIRTA